MEICKAESEKWQRHGCEEIVKSADSGARMYRCVDLGWLCTSCTTLYLIYKMGTIAGYAS